MTLLRLVIGVVLRRARQEQGKTLRDVADAARVSVQYLSEVERGRKEASSEVLAAVCGALGWTILDLLDEVRSDLAATSALPVGVTAPGREPVPGRGPVRASVEVASVEVAAPVPLRAVAPVALTSAAGQARVAA